MDAEITNLSIESLNRYFDTLKIFGYKNYNEVTKLIIFLAIEEVMTSEFSFFITEEDYNTITKALYCLYGSSCLIDFPTFNTYDELIHKNLNIYSPRLTEDNVFRKDYELRIME